MYPAPCLAADGGHGCEDEDDHLHAARWRGEYRILPPISKMKN